MLTDLFHVLVFSKTDGYRHTSIPAGISCIRNIATRTRRFTIEASEDASFFTTKNLSRYAVIVLLQCIGEILDQEQLNALREFVRGGRGVVAVHGAAAGMPNDEWYGKLIGAHFDHHPPHELGTVLVETANQEHVILCRCGGREGWLDEWYNFCTHPRDNRNLNVLLRGDAESFKGGKHSDDHPLVWCQEFEGGRSFFTALGHFDEAYEDEWFIGMLQRGIIWAARQEDAIGKAIENC